MKSLGPIGLLKKNNKSKELILQQIEDLKRMFRNVDVYVISGFGNEKLQKTIEKKRNVYNIINKQYANKNQSYAIKLFMNEIKDSIDKYHGVFFIDSNIIIKNLVSKSKNKSWLVVSKKPNPGDKDRIGVNINNEAGRVRYLFYNIGEHNWCQSFYLQQKHLKYLIKMCENCHDNMFLFEMINKMIDQYQINISVNYLQKTKDYIYISGPKDKSKIK
jgi:choline kinase